MTLYEILNIDIYNIKQDFQNLVLCSSPVGKINFIIMNFDELLTES